MDKVKKKYKGIIAIIPARGGSNGIHGKNIMDFCGKPLLAWSILQARQAKTVNAVYVTSDDEAILRVAEDFGAIPIRRPDELSTDTATSEAALLHALDTIESDGTKIDLVIFLQATSPLREPRDIDGAIETLFKEQADSLFTSAKLEDFFIWEKSDQGLISINCDYQRWLRRQDVNPPVRGKMNYCEQNDYFYKKVLYAGNDLNDMEVMKIVGFPVAPADAHADIKFLEKLVTKAKGGEGVIKELAECLDTDEHPG